MRIITEKEVEEIVDIKEAYTFIEQSYADFSAGNTVTPETTSMEVNDGMFYSFPSYITGTDFFISKQASDFRNNKQRDLPSVHPYILVFNSTTGVCLAIIEGRYFASVRTALSSAVGVKHLANEPERLAILGTGVQGRSHGVILAQLFPSIQDITLYSPTKEHREEAAVYIESQVEQGTVIAADDSKQAVHKADVIVCATTSKTPVFKHGDVKDDVVIIGVGAMKNDQEIPAETIGSSAVILDAKKNLPMYDEVNIAKQENYTVEVLGEIGSVINKDDTVEKNMRIVFKHHGLPVTDAALAASIISKISI